MDFMNQTITLWNKFLDDVSRTQYYFKHTINKCNWETDIVQNVAGTTVSMGTSFSVLVENRPEYKPYEEWKNLPIDLKEQYFTFYTGDIVYKGTTDIVIDGTTGKTPADVREELLPNYFEIKVIQDETESYKDCQHIEISGV